MTLCDNPGHVCKPSKSVHQHIRSIPEKATSPFINFLCRLNSLPTRHRIYTKISYTHVPWTWESSSSLELLRQANAWIGGYYLCLHAVCRAFNHRLRVAWMEFAWLCLTLPHFAHSDSPAHNALARMFHFLDSLLFSFTSPFSRWGAWFLAWFFAWFFAWFLAVDFSCPTQGALYRHYHSRLVWKRVVG